MGTCQTREHVREGVHVNRKPLFNDIPAIIDQKNLELYYLLWLDSTVNSPELIETKDELRSIINYLKTFERNSECQAHFEQITHGKIFLLVNCTQSISLLPIIHDYKQLHSIYIYHNGDSMDMESVSKQYRKIRGVYDSFVVAKRYLEDDVEMHTQLDEPMVMDLLEEMNDMEYREKFTLFLKIMNVNANNIYDKQTRNRLIETCEEYYEENDEEINFLEEFSLSYKSEQAISWYMRESCLHRIMSRAFIEHDISLLVDLYSFIVDINRNVQQQSVKSSIRVYRSQFLSKERLIQLKMNIQQLITMQCIFSAQTSREESLRFLQSIEPNEASDQRILFEIDVSQDYTVVEGDQPATSKTVLFMLGATFQIVEVTETTVVLSQYTSRLNNHDDLVNESPLVIRGILTYLRDGPRDAIRYYEDILKKKSTTDLATCSSIYGQLGYLKEKSGNLGGATKMYEQAMSYGNKQFGLHLFYLEQAAQYHGSVLNDWDKAKTLWLQKLHIQSAFLSEQEKAQTYENLAQAALKTKQPAQAAEYTLAAIANLPSDHPRLPLLRRQLESTGKNASDEITT